MGLAVIGLLVFASGALADPADPWWNTSYTFRQELNISANNTCGNLSYYQIEFNVSYEDGSSAGNTIYTNGSSQVDFDDLRFLDLADNEQPYWFENVVNGVNATVWVNFSTINITGSTYYIYYGNGSVEDTSDGDQTFQMFNVNASGGLHNFWHFDEAGYDGTPNEVHDECNDGHGVRYGDATTSTLGKFFNCSIYDGTSDYILTASTPPTLGTAGIALEFWENSSVTNPIGIVDSDPGNTFTLRNYNAGQMTWRNGGATNPANDFVSIANTWVHWIFVFYHDGNNQISEYKNGALTDTVAGTSSTGFAWDEFCMGGINKGTAGSFTGTLDEFRVWEVDNIADFNTLLATASNGSYYMENMSSYFNFRKYSACDPTTPYATEYGEVEGLELGCPSALIITSLGGDEVQLNWTGGLYNQHYMVRMKAGEYPINYSDGQQIYFGTNNSTTDDGLSLDTTTYYYRVWGGTSGIWSDCYAEGTIGGEYMLYLTYGLVCLGLSGLAFWRKWTWVYMLAAIAWFGFGGYGLSGHSTGDIIWVFGWVGIAAGLVLIMAPAWNHYKDKKEEDAEKKAALAEQKQSYEDELEAIYKGKKNEA